MNLFLTPEAILLETALALVLAICFAPGIKIRDFAGLAMLGVTFALTFLLTQSSYEPPLWGKLYAADGLAVFFKGLFLVATFFVLWMAGIERESKNIHDGREFFVFLLIAASGMTLLASATDFVALFVALELITICFYILVAYQKDCKKSLEAGVKYLIIGALSTACFVYGIAFLYGTLGTTQFSVISEKLAGLSCANAGLLFALVLIAVGLGFKIAAVPFHSWAPDVYQGAPAPVTAFLATASKAAGVVALIRIFQLSGFYCDALREPIGGMLAALAAGSLILGSFAAIPQQNVKRLLGYSTIANTGFLLIALGCLTERGAHATIFYLVVYLLAALLVFSAMCVVSSKLEGDEIKNYSGLSRRSPFLAFALLIGFVSLAGIPPLAGFFGKVSVFAAAWENGSYVLFVIGLICAVAGIYYYLKIVRAMYWLEPEEENAISISPSITTILSILIAAIIFFGIWPQLLLQLIEKALVFP